MATIEKIAGNAPRTEVVAKADTVCVVVADPHETGTYRTGATITALQVRVESRDKLQWATRWTRRVSTVAVVVLAAASVVASAWRIALSRGP